MKLGSAARVKLRNGVETNVLLVSCYSSDATVSPNPSQEAPNTATRKALWRMYDLPIIKERKGQGSNKHSANDKVPDLEMVECIVLLSATASDTPSVGMFCRSVLTYATIWSRGYDARKSDERQRTLRALLGPPLVAWTGGATIYNPNPNETLPPCTAPSTQVPLVTVVDEMTEVCLASAGNSAPIVDTVPGFAVGGIYHVKGTFTVLDSFSRRALVFDRRKKLSERSSKIRQKLLHGKIT
ncbi:hypothetical protein V8F06_006655 [Rhypophila decipiens]